jgi:hypothetical protein
MLGADPLWQRLFDAEVYHEVVHKHAIVIWRENAAERGAVVFVYTFLYTLLLQGMLAAINSLISSAGSNKRSAQMLNASQHRCMSNASLCDAALSVTYGASDGKDSFHISMIPLNFYLRSCCSCVFTSPQPRGIRWHERRAKTRRVRKTKPG